MAQRWQTDANSLYGDNNIAGAHTTSESIELECLHVGRFESTRPREYIKVFIKYFLLRLLPYRKMHCFETDRAP